MHTCIGYQQILGLMRTEHSVALEDLEGLASSVGDLDVDHVVACIRNRNGQRASRRSRASKKNDRKSLGKHGNKI